METGNTIAKARRHTIQRKLILETIRAMEGKHPTAAEVHKEIRRLHPEISVATVYNQLRKLSDDGIIKVFSGLGQADRFDSIMHEHYHVKCKKCGEVRNLNMDLAININEMASKSSGYEICNHHIVFFGICENCKDQDNTLNLL